VQHVFACWGRQGNLIRIKRHQPTAHFISKRERLLPVDA
jgi:hypothetical protein